MLYLKNLLTNPREKRYFQKLTLNDQAQPNEEEQDKDEKEDDTPKHQDLPKEWRYAHGHPKELILGDPSKGVRTRALIRNEYDYISFVVGDAK